MGESILNDLVRNQLERVKTFMIVVERCRQEVPPGKLFIAAYLLG